MEELSYFEWKRSDLSYNKWHYLIIQCRWDLLHQRLCDFKVWRQELKNFTDIELMALKRKLVEIDENTETRSKADVDKKSVIKEKYGVTCLSPPILMPQVMLKCKHLPRHEKLPINSKTKKHSSFKHVNSCMKSILGPPPHLLSLLRRPVRSSSDGSKGVWLIPNSMTIFSLPQENDAANVKRFLYIPRHRRTRFKWPRK